MLQCKDVSGHLQLFLGGTRFNVIGIMRRVTLDPGLDRGAFVGPQVLAHSLAPEPTDGDPAYARISVPLAAADRSDGRHPAARAAPLSLTDALRVC